MRFIYLIFLSVVLFILTDRLIYVLYRSISGNFYEHQGEHPLNRDVGAQEKQFYDTLVMGSSRTKQAIHPWYLDRYSGLKAKTIADLGRYPRYNYRAYKIFKKKFRTPLYLIYGVDYFIFDQKSNLRAMKTLLGFKTKPGTKKKFTLDPELFIPYPVPSLLLRDKKKIDDFFMDVLDHLKERKRGETDGPLISGFRGMKTSVRPGSLTEPPVWSKKAYVRFPGYEGRFFDLFLDELNRDNVRVFLVIIPDVIGVYETNFERKLFESELVSLSEKYPNVTLLNYSSPERFDLSNPAFFRDGGYGQTVSHLSFYGAEAFNRILCRDLNNLIGENQ